MCVCLLYGARVGVREGSSYVCYTVREWGVRDGSSYVCLLYGTRVGGSGRQQLCVFVVRYESGGSGRQQLCVFVIRYESGAFGTAAAMCVCYTVGFGTAAAILIIHDWHSS